MKKLILSLLFLMVATSAHANDFEIGGDFVIPYRVNTPKNRLAMMDGAHVEAYLTDNLTVGVTALFGLETDGFVKKPVYIIPGLTFYIPFAVLSPFARASLPVLANNGQDIGVQGSLGLSWDMLAGLGLEYSVDAARYFDSKANVINWVHIGLDYTF